MAELVPLRRGNAARGFSIAEMYPNLAVYSTVAGNESMLRAVSNLLRGDTFDAANVPNSPAVIDLVRRLVDEFHLPALERARAERDAANAAVIAHLYLHPFPFPDYDFIGDMHVGDDGTLAFCLAKRLPAAGSAPWRLLAPGQCFTFMLLRGLLSSNRTGEQVISLSDQNSGTMYECPLFQGSGSTLREKSILAMARAFSAKLYDKASSKRAVEVLLSTNRPDEPEERRALDEECKAFLALGDYHRHGVKRRRCVSLIAAEPAAKLTRRE